MQKSHKLITKLILGVKRTGAERVVGTFELVARSKIFALCCYAFEIVRVVLEAMPRLVCVGETS